VEFFNNLRKIVLVVEYDGKRYHGFQWQKGKPTIQDELEKAACKLTGETRRISAACRTDAGVHAKGQVVAFLTASGLPPGTFVSGMNHYLPGDIAVVRAGTVSDRFNVMKEAARREYRYRILNRKLRSPLQGEYCHIVGGPLDIDIMNEASRLLVGEHDFASFVTAWDRDCSTVRCVYEAGVEREDEIVTFRVVANSYLTHQVRNIVGTLVRVGNGKMDIGEFKSILEMKQLSLAGPTAPARGLCLMKVVYADNSEFKYENLCA
jgi:tRNA pseudouridine38-40 synthase